MTTIPLIFFVLSFYELNNQLIQLLLFYSSEPDGNANPYDNIIVPKSLAKDFLSLHKMLQRVKWPNIRLAGPDTATLHSGNEFYSRSVTVVVLCYVL